MHGSEVLPPTLQCELDVFGFEAYDFIILLDLT